MFIRKFQGFRQIPNRKAFHPLRRFNNTNRPSYVSHDYLMKIVPTIYEDINGIRRYPYQYTFVYRVNIFGFNCLLLCVKLNHLIRYDEPLLTYRILEINYFLVHLDFYRYILRREKEQEKRRQKTKVQ